MLRCKVPRQWWKNRILQEKPVNLLAQARLNPDEHVYAEVVKLVDTLS